MTESSSPASVIISVHANARSGRKMIGNTPPAIGKRQPARSMQGEDLHDRIDVLTVAPAGDGEAVERIIRLATVAEVCVISLTFCLLSGIAVCCTAVFRPTGNLGPTGVDALFGGENHVADPDS